MRIFNSNSEDRELTALNWIFVNGSMTLTAYFGWTLGEDIFILAVILAALFAAISRAAPLLTRYAAEYTATGMARGAMLCGVFGGLFFFADVLTNFGSSAAIRENSMVTATNRNEVATNAKNEVSRLESRIDTIKQQTSWKTDYLAPSAYDALIASATLARDNEAKRKYCGRKCEAKTAELAELQANKANAERRLALKEEMKQLETELIEAKLKVEETPTVASAAISQVKNLAGLLTLSTTPDEFSKTWTNNGIMVVAAIIISLGSVLTSMVLGLRIGARRMQGHAYHEETAPRADNRWVADHRTEADRAAAPPNEYEDPHGYAARPPQPLRAAGNSSTTINATVTGGGKPNPYTMSKVDNMLDEIKDIMRRREQEAA